MLELKNYAENSKIAATSGGVAGLSASVGGNMISNKGGAGTGASPFANMQVIVT